MASKVAAGPTSEAAEFVSPFQEHLNRFPEDSYLRKHGFRIHGRPRGGRLASTWSRHGSVYNFLDALRLADAEAGEVHLTTVGPA